MNKERKEGTDFKRREKMVMKIPRLATIVSDRDEHYIDHLAPISHKLNIPMIVNDEEIESLIHNHYPKVKVIYKHSIDLGFYMTQNFEIVYTCLPDPLFRQLCFVAELILGKTLFNIWSPHGQSDKGHVGCYIESLAKESFALVYGKKMTDFLIEKGSFDQLIGTITTGNYRLKYYMENQSFYRKKLKERLCFNDNKTILYAPTWKDNEGSYSFDRVIKDIITMVPNHFNLLIKPHPNMFQSGELNPFLLSQLPTKENVAFLSHFPPIYPLLDFADVYLGDMSSIGYDFLSFKKPMFFFNVDRRDPSKDKGLYLTQCGVLIEPKDHKNIFSIIEDKMFSPFEKIQTAVYDQVFGEEEDFKQKIIEAYGNKY